MLHRECKREDFNLLLVVTCNKNQIDVAMTHLHRVVSVGSKLGRIGPKGYKSWTLKIGLSLVHFAHVWFTEPKYPQAEIKKFQICPI